MSLLSNPWFSVGMGLLANSGPSLTPVNPWRGIGQGLMAANEAKAMEAQQAYEQRRMEVEQQKYEQEQQRQQMLQQWAQTQPDPQGAALFPEKSYEMANKPPPDSVRLSTAGAEGLQGFAPETPIEVKMSNGQPVDYTPMTPPAPQTSGIQLQLPSGQQVTAASVQEANKYLENGATYYKPPPSVQVNNNMDKGVTVADAANLRYPDGSRVIPGTPLQEIHDRKAVSVTQADNTESVTDVNIKGYDESLKKAGVSLKNANKAYHDDPSAANYQKLKAARSAAATALAQRRNTKGEPSGEIVQGAEADFPLPFSAGGAMGAAMGADPIEASLRQVDELYGLGIYEEDKPKWKHKGEASDIYKAYPGLKRAP